MIRHVEKFAGSIDDFALRLIFEDGDALEGVPIVELVGAESLEIGAPTTYTEADAVTLIVVYVSGGTAGERAVLRYVANTTAGRRVVEEIEIRVI